VIGKSSDIRLLSISAPHGIKAIMFAMM